MSPRIEFKCPICSISIEQVRGFDTDAPAPICGDCLINMDRVISPNPAIFKGSGWAGKK